MPEQTSSRSTILERAAFRDFQLMDNELFEFIADNKERLIATTFKEAVETGWFPNTRTSFAVYLDLQRKAGLFDLFMALAED